MRLSWAVVWLAAAVCGVQVSADQPAFPENVRRSPAARIVSGWKATEGQIPWQLSVRMVNSIGTVGSCGGSIIHPDWGFTAAHCTANRITMVLRAGAVSLWQPELIFETIEFYGHPSYNPAMQGTVQPHDISLLKFPVSLTFSDRIQPIRVQRSAEKNQNFDGVKLEASGWGRTWTNGALPNNLQWVYLVGDTNERCREAYTGFDIVVDSTICASAYNLTSQSTCSGDSGGPLVEMEEDGKYTLVGVTSFVSVDGCHVDSPAGFIRPGHYHDWITQITGIHFYPEPERITAVALTSFSKTSSSSESTESSGDSGDIYTTEASITDADSSNESADSADSSQDSVETISTTEALSSSESSETNGSIRIAESEETVTVTEDATTESDTDANENLSSHDSDSSFTKSILLNHESVIDWRG